MPKRGRSRTNKERTTEIATKRSSRIADSKIIYFQEKFSIKKPTYLRNDSAPCR
jgi:hypothetical protein